MSATAATSAPAAPATPQRRPAGSVTQLRVIRSEWTKLWSLRSTRWSLLIAFISMAGLGPLISAVTMSRWSHLHADDRSPGNLIDHSLGGWHLAQLAVAVLGVLVISGEYSTGSIRSSLMAVPRRLPVLWAKLVVFGVVAFVLMLIAGLISFYASQSILTQHHVNVGLGYPHAFRALIGTVLYMTMTGILCTGIATIVRSTAGGIATFVGVLFVLPGITDLLPQSTSNAISPYLPSNAGSVVAQIVRDPHTLSSWAGFALFCGYTAATVAVAAYLLRRRDA